MALTGHLSDLSLSELIEFFCNQRKSGRLTVLYPQGPGYFYLQSGSVVDARIGVVRGIDAVYYALTLPNAKFEFNASAESSERTINQPWTQVVLEGLRRLDEGVTPPDAFPSGYEPEMDSVKDEVENATSTRRESMPAFLSFLDKESISKRKPLFGAGVVVAVLGSVAAVGVPAGWYSRNTVSAVATMPPAPAPTPEASAAPTDQPPAQPTAPEQPSANEDAAALAARRQRERDRAKREDRASMANRSVATQPSAEDSKGPKKVSVTVTYDESGRVVQASGADPSAIRIARQKRFPPGKAGSATITIPIN
ncbi:MAG TPA: DUF4388 domain-containing protein [Pyrinomonadaceae bacterium]|nr:DUF4388 domain-containing protein [Pyrinomonadaceae bacterium]